MTKYQIYHKNYTELGETYQLVLPLCLEGLIPEDESVRLISHELEELDYTLLYQAYAKGNKRLHVSKNFIEKRQISYKNIMSETGAKYRMNRSIQVEGAFGVLKNDYEFQRFLLRGKTKVKLEILLLCFGYNINKLHAKIQNDRLGSYLFPLKTA